jgi:hypothetical protein
MYHVVFSYQHLELAGTLMLRSCYDLEVLYPGKDLKAEHPLWDL